MRRRVFIKKSMAAAGSILGGSFLFSACKENLRYRLMAAQIKSPGGVRNDMGLDEKIYKILYYASLAPSGHNSQPWLVRQVSRNQFIIELDKSRRLLAVDPDMHESILSLGAFMENINIAAGQEGLSTHVNIIAENTRSREVAEIIFKKDRPVDYPLHRLAMRRTVKGGMLPRELSMEDVKAFEQKSGPGLYYFPRKSRHARFMEEQAIENFTIQTRNDNAQEELSRWIRFKDKDVEKFRDGLSVKSMEINGIAGWYVKNFMDKRDVTGKRFRQKGIEKTIKQVRQGGGWLVITGNGNLPADLLDSGQRFQRMALIARERNIAIHPMTQTLEEENGQKNIRKNHDSGMVPHFMLRVGYVDKYPDPVTLRRPVEWFVR